MRILMMIDLFVQFFIKKAPAKQVNTRVSTIFESVM